VSRGRRAARDALPPELAEQFDRLLADGFRVWCCGRKSDPNALLASYDWDGYVDLATMTAPEFEVVTTARVVRRGTVDVFDPKTVVWAFQGAADDALRSLLDLVHPDHPAAPRFEHPAPPAMVIPPDLQRPTSIRIPSAGAAGVRAVRLAALMKAPAPLEAAGLTVSGQRP
jgi:hypothetical protein